MLRAEIIDELEGIVGAEHLCSAEEATLRTRNALGLERKPLCIIAGALFGLKLGTLAVVAGSLVAAALQYALARRLLREKIQRALAARPSLAAIQRAVMRDELRLQALLRLTPLNPATAA